MKTSRFITSPDTVKKEDNQTIVLVDANQKEVEDLALFCKVCREYYDIYLYRSDEDSKEWLNTSLQSADHVLISLQSNVRVQKRPNLKVDYFGTECKYKVPLNYLQAQEK